eukprot:TRINITY_DN4475_c0_g1_i1.p1 TRINITY_DN4475_c0_g1~~TRINITY_DN4475_c0_g1_i1.p1  ORF type:complete len:223 (+),score=42.42 TRINITY_DN4475_c0_g1_i1:350-1018(+)
MGQTCGCTAGNDAVHPDTLKNTAAHDGSPRIDLSETRIDEKRALGLAETLRCSSVVCLNLSWCDLSAAPLQILCDAMEHSCVASLILTGNGIRDVRPLCNMLRRDPPLSYLNLGCNAITKDGLRDLLEALDSNTRLSMLCLGGNRIGDITDTEQSFVVDHLKGNRALQLLDLRGNLLDDAVLGAVMGRFADSLRLTGPTDVDRGVSFLSSRSSESFNLSCLS